MTAATLKRRLIELESKITEQDTELEVLHILRDRLREAEHQIHHDPRMDGYQEPDNAHLMTIGELTIHALKWKHRDK